MTQEERYWYWLTEARRWELYAETDARRGLERQAERARKCAARCRRWAEEVRRGE